MFKLFKTVEMLLSLKSIRKAKMLNKCMRFQFTNSPPPIQQKSISTVIH